MARMLVSLLVLGAAMVGGASAAAAPPAAALKLRVMASNASLGIYADGVRWAVVTAAGGAFRAIDTLRGTQFTVDGCGTPGSVRSRVIVIRCGWQTRLLDLTTRQTVDLALVGDEQFTNAGAHWVEGGAGSGSESQVVYLNWRTGERRYQPIVGATPVMKDLNDPSLGDLSLVRDGAVVAVDSPLIREQWPTSMALGRLAIARKGGERVIRRTCQCMSLRYSAGWLTWAEGASVFAHHVRRRRTFTFVPSRNFADRHGLGVSPDGTLDAELQPQVVHTATRIFVSYSTPQLSWAQAQMVPHRTVVLEARLPAGRTR